MQLAVAISHVSGRVVQSLLNCCCPSTLYQFCNVLLVVMVKNIIYKWKVQSTFEAQCTSFNYRYSQLLLTMILGIFHNLFVG